MNLFRELALGSTVVLSTVGVLFGQHYSQTNLQANSAGVAESTDSQLVDSRGLARTSGSVWWVANNATGVATLYDGGGAKQSLVVTIPPADPTKTPTGSPTAIIGNGSTTDFLLAAGAPSLFIFTTLDGTIAAWNPIIGLANGSAPPSTNAVTVVKTSDGSVFTGLTSAFLDGRRTLYAANPSKGRVDVFDNAFHLVKLKNNPEVSNGNFDPLSFDPLFPGGKPFEDPELPRNYVPFNVATVGNDIVVTFALELPGQAKPTAGPGLGYVDIFDSNGRLLRRLEHGPWLNVPWGVTLAPQDFGRFSHDLLVGQFANAGNTESSGLIAAYDLATGRFDGLVQDANGKPLVIQGIWSLSPGNVSPASLDPDDAPAAQVYFTAGPNGESGGVFGYLTAVPTELIQGSNQ